MVLFILDLKNTGNKKSSLKDPKTHGVLYHMVAHFVMHPYGVNQEFRFVEGIWLHRNSRQIRFFLLSEITIFYIIRAHHILSYHLI